MLSDAQKIINVWLENDSFSMGDVSSHMFKAALTALTEADRAVEAERQKPTALLNACDAEIATLSQLVTRTRSGISSYFKG